MEKNIKIDYDKKEWNGNPLICPCCGQYSFKIQDNYEICPICNWEDDVRQKKEPDRAGGANKLSLNQFRLEWLDKQLKKPVV